MSSSESSGAKVCRTKKWGRDLILRWWHLRNAQEKIVTSDTSDSLKICTLLAGTMSSSICERSPMVSEAGELASAVVVAIVKEGGFAARHLDISFNWLTMTCQDYLNYFNIIDFMSELTVMTRNSRCWILLLDFGRSPRWLFLQREAESMNR